MPSSPSEDIAFLIRHGAVTAGQMEAAFESVRIPDVQELRDAFDRALPEVRRLLLDPPTQA